MHAVAKVITQARMANKFLKATHWQLFLWTFGGPFIIQVAWLMIMVGNLANGNDLKPIGIPGSMGVAVGILVISMSVIFGWYWSVATGL